MTDSIRSWYSGCRKTHVDCRGGLSPPAMNSIFHLRNLVFGYTSTPVLQGISAEITAGELVALVGPNGAGKSTLLKVLAGLVRGYSGSIEFSGKSLSRWSARELEIGRAHVGTPAT